VSDRTAIDQIGLELHEMAQNYAAKADSLASDPYFRDAVVKVSVSSFVWALYHTFAKDGHLEVLRDELIEQTAAVSRSLGTDGVAA
jgi:ligand-binding SRPBCC domain-containing protein